MRHMMLALLLWYCGYRWVRWECPTKDRGSLAVGDWLYTNDPDHRGFHRVTKAKDYTYFKSYTCSDYYYVNSDDPIWQPSQRTLIHKDNIVRAKTGQIRLRRTPEWNYIN